MVFPQDSRICGEHWPQFYGTSLENSQGPQGAHSTSPDIFPGIQNPAGFFSRLFLQADPPQLPEPLLVLQTLSIGAIVY